MECFFRHRASPFRGAMLLALLGVWGCQTCPAPSVAPASDGPCQVQEHYPLVEAPAAAGLATLTSAETVPVCPHPVQALALSGGVAGAPFTAGVLVGWTQSGTRPTFDVVSGISSGALLGALAFLGPKYDPKLQELMLSLHTSDLFRLRPLRCLVCDGSFGSALPAKRLLRKVFDEELLDDLRQAHAEGRRLFVGTMNLETKRLAIWDIGAIACSERPDAGELIRKVMLAAMSWPGVFPSVEFEVEEHGHCHREHHCDAGSVAMAFVRFGCLPGWPGPGQPVCPGWLAGSNLYVLTSRKLYSDPAPVSSCAVPRVMLSMSGLFEALTRADIDRLYSFCAASGMRFHLIAVPPEHRSEPMCFTHLFPKEAPKLFETGRQMGASGPGWRTTPPGADPGEEAIPRDGRELISCR